MKRYLLSALIGLATLSASATPLKSYNFNTAIPSGFQTYKGNWSILNTKYYDKQLSIQPGWNRVKVADSDFTAQTGIWAMTSATVHDDASNPDNWLIFPEITVEESDVIRFEACSIADAKPESFQIMISETGSTKPEDFQNLEFYDGVPHMWDIYQIDLCNAGAFSKKSYAGKTIRLAIVQNNPGYMLAIRNVWMGNGRELLPVASNAGRIFFADNESDKKLSFLLKYPEFGKSPASFCVKNSSTGKVFGSVSADVRTYASEEALTVNVPIELALDEAFEYELWVNYEDGTSDKLLANQYVNCGKYLRKMLVEKFTGTWCNNCPRVYFPAAVYLDMLGDDAIYVEAHTPSSGATIYDKNGCNEYIMPLPYSVRGDFPELFFNRTYKQDKLHPYDRAGIKEALLMPCDAGVKVRILSYDGHHVSAEATIESAVDLDNSGDSYRVGFTLTEGHAYMGATDYPQKNNVGRQQDPNAGEFQFLPTTVPNDMMAFHNVVRGDTKGSLGTEKSLPSQIKAGESYTVPFEYDLPLEENGGLIKNAFNLQLVATITQNIMNDKGTALSKVPVLNADMVPLTHSILAGADKISEAKQPEISVSKQGADILVNFIKDGSYEVSAWTLLGQKLALANGVGNSALLNLSGVAPGTVVLIKASANGESATAKIVM